MYRQIVLADGEYYHVFNRGVEQRNIFLDRRDYQRFGETLEHYRFNDPVVKFSTRNRPSVVKLSSRGELLVEVVAFCLMPNHFHLLLKQVSDNGISTFMNRLTNSYTRYFNVRHQRVGPLMQGSFKAVHVESNEQLLHLSRYIHLNPLVAYLEKDLRNYEYSSFNQFVGINQSLCTIQIVMNQFSNGLEYERFILDQVDYARSLKNIEHLMLD